MYPHFLVVVVFQDFISLFLERERNINVWLSLMWPLLGTWPTTQACALDWESNQRPFSLQAGTQSTEPHQPGLLFVFCFCICIFGFLIRRESSGSKGLSGYPRSHGTQMADLGMKFSVFFRSKLPLPSTLLMQETSTPSFHQNNTYHPPPALC